MDEMTTDPGARRRRGKPVPRREPVGKGGRKSGKMLAVLALCAAVGAGGIGIATAPGRADAEMPSEAASPMRNVAGLAAPVVKAVELGVTPTDGAKAVNPAAPASVKARI